MIIFKRHKKVKNTAWKIHSGVQKNIGPIVADRDYQSNSGRWLIKLGFQFMVSISLILWKQCLIYSHRRHYGFNICTCKERWSGWMSSKVEDLEASLTLLWKKEYLKVWYEYGKYLSLRTFLNQLPLLKGRTVFICKFVYYLPLKSFLGLLLNSFPRLLSLQTLFQTNDVLLDSIIQNPFLLLWRWL